MITDKEFNEIFAWLHHYEYEFNESPYPKINRIVKILQKHYKGYE